MDNLTKNRISNIMYRCGIEENMNNLAEHVNGKQIDLYNGYLLNTVCEYLLNYFIGWLALL